VFKARPLIAAALLLCTLPALLPVTVAPAQTAPGTFVETFDGNPTIPQPWRQAGWSPRWAVGVTSRDRPTFDRLDGMNAEHGADCAGPPATHPTSAYEDAVFQCKDHVMTAISAGGYGMISLTPNAMAG
jgi:hypothetical protein